MLCNLTNIFSIPVIFLDPDCAKGIRQHPEDGQTPPGRTHSLSPSDLLEPIGERGGGLHWLPLDWVWEFAGTVGRVLPDKGTKVRAACSWVGALRFRERTRSSRTGSVRQGGAGDDPPHPSQSSSSHPPVSHYPALPGARCRSMPCRDGKGPPGSPEMQRARLDAQ